MRVMALSLRGLVLCTLLAAAVLVAPGTATQPQRGDASAHRNAPLILEDPTADSSDLYAFVSTEPARQEYVTVLSNWVPFEAPTDAPFLYRFSDSVLYEIKIDANGDALADLTYQFRFRTTFALDDAYLLYNFDRITVPRNADDPSAQYGGLNYRQSYSLTEVTAAGSRVLLQDARIAPWRVGPRSVGSRAEYQALADAAIFTPPNAGGLRVWAGPRADPFFADTGGFDLVTVRNPGVNGFASYNIHTLALEIPKARFAQFGNTTGTIGIWATGSRHATRNLIPGHAQPEQSGDWVQVKRVANPLFNAEMVPLRMKDLYHATQPTEDGPNFRQVIVDPGPTPPTGIVSGFALLLGCTETTGRIDLQGLFLTGIPPAIVPGFPGNYTGPVLADLLRLNYNVPPAANPNRLAHLAGDVAGWPNGRRPMDDVIDISHRIVAGELQPLVGLQPCPVAALAGGDNLDAPDVPLMDRFPYLGIPYAVIESD